MPNGMRIFVITDGASRRNPGPSAICYGIYDTNWNIIREYAEYIGTATNNEAEYKAVIHALDCATGICRGHIVHYSDSELIVRQLNGSYRVKAKNLKPLIEEIFRKKLFFSSVIHMHLPRTNEKIQRIDELVNNELTRIGF